MKKGRPVRGGLKSEFREGSRRADRRFAQCPGSPNRITGRRGLVDARLRLATSLPTTFATNSAANRDWTLAPIPFADFDA